MRLRRAKSFVWLGNLENLRNKDKEEAVPLLLYLCSPLLRILRKRGEYTAYSYRCELIFILLLQVFQNLQAKNVLKAHTLFVFSTTYHIH